MKKKCDKCFTPLEVYTCDICEGTGKMDKMKCDYCEGKGTRLGCPQCYPKRKLKRLSPK